MQKDEISEEEADKIRELAFNKQFCIPDEERTEHLDSLIENLTRLGIKKHTIKNCIKEVIEARPQENELVVAVNKLKNTYEKALEYNISLVKSIKESLNMIYQYNGKVNFTSVIDSMRFHNDFSWNLKQYQGYNSFNVELYLLHDGRNENVFAFNLSESTKKGYWPWSETITTKEYEFEYMKSWIKDNKINLTGRTTEDISVVPVIIQSAHPEIKDFLKEQVNRIPEMITDYLKD